MLAKPTTARQSVALYRRLLHFWELHLGGRDPDLRQLADIHKTLCRLEFDLYPQLLDECLANLTQRLRQSRSAGARASAAAVGRQRARELETAAQAKKRETSRVVHARHYHRSAS